METLNTIHRLNGLGSSSKSSKECAFCRTKIIAADLSILLAQPDDIQTADKIINEIIGDLTHAVDLLNEALGCAKHNLTKAHLEKTKQQEISLTNCITHRNKLGANNE